VAEGRVRGIVALVFLFFCLDLHARCNVHTFVQPPPAYTPAAAKARSIICAQLAPHVPAAEVAVGVDGRLVWSAGFGRVGEMTPIRIGSISKPMTADVFTLLVQEGKLDPDAPVERYVPNLPEDLPITSRQLAGHLSGIRHYKNNKAEIYANKHYASVTEGLAVFENDPLLFQPGTPLLNVRLQFALHSRARRIRISQRCFARWSSSRSR